MQIEALSWSEEGAASRNAKEAALKLQLLLASEAKDTWTSNGEIRKSVQSKLAAWARLALEGISSSRRPESLPPAQKVALTLLKISLLTVIRFVSLCK